MNSASWYITKTRLSRTVGNRCHFEGRSGLSFAGGTAAGDLGR